MDDRKMFSPLRHGTPVSPAGALGAVLRRHDAGATAAVLANDMVIGGFAVGSRSAVTKRVAELLGEMETAGAVERLRDGRYRVVRAPGPGRSR